MTKEKKTAGKKPVINKATPKKPAAPKKAAAKSAEVASSVVKTVLNPAAAWPFPTGTSRP